MSVLVERQHKEHPRRSAAGLDRDTPVRHVRHARRVPRPVDRTRPPGRPKRVTAPHVVAAPRLPRPRPLPLVYLLIVGAAVCAAIYGLGMLASSTAAGSVPERTVPVMVAPGQSLWSLAQQHAPDSDPAAVVDRIRDLNDLDAGDPVAVGTPLTVPDGH